MNFWKCIYQLRTYCVQTGRVQVYINLKEDGDDRKFILLIVDKKEKEESDELYFYYSYF